MRAGSAQQSMQRKGRIERRHQQLRAKQRLRPGAAGGEAARARSSSSASTAFTPEGEASLCCICVCLVLVSVAGPLCIKLVFCALPFLSVFPLPSRKRL